MGVTQCRSDNVIAYGTLLRGCLGCRRARSMSRFAAFNDNSASCNGADMPVVIFIKLPLCAFGMLTVGGAVPSGSTNLIAVCAIIVVLLYALTVCAGACNIVCGIFNLLCEAVIAGGGAGVILISCRSVIFRIGVATGACVPVHIVLRAI